MIKTKRLKRFTGNTTQRRTKLIPNYYINKSIGDGHMDVILNTALEWCKLKFGKQRGKMPQIDWDWDFPQFKEDETWAEYLVKENCIRVRVLGHRTIYNLVNTIIHEYVHYLQPRKGTWYGRYQKKFGYDLNPYEVEANYIAYLWDVECTHKVIETLYGVPVNRLIGANRGTKRGLKGGYRV